jgi:hypothetical protein
MKFVYDISGAEPILRDYPVYDAASLNYGTLLQLGTTDPDVGADEGQALVNAYNATAANSGTNIVGMLNENTYESGGTVPDRVPSTTTGPYYGKVIINPLAIYRGEISLAAADDIAITSTAAATLTVPSLADDIDGCFVYFPLTQTGVKGSLRQLIASAAGSATMDSALVTTGGATDTIVIISREFKSPANLGTAGDNFVGSSAAAPEAAVKFIILNRMADLNGGIVPLRYADHSGLNGLDLIRQGIGPKFFYDVLAVDHLFNNVS